jgi:hypothetical protein
LRNRHFAIAAGASQERLFGYGFERLPRFAWGKRHWIPHDALAYWTKAGHTPLKPLLDVIREARNGVHAHLFQKKLVTSQTVRNVTFVVDAMFKFIETKNARNFMKALYARGEISTADYNAWKRKPKKTE